MKYTKPIALLLFAVACITSMQADNDHLQYQYDAAGNRIGRVVVHSQPQQAPRRNIPVVDVTVSPTITEDVVTIATAIDLGKSPMKYTLTSIQGNVLNTGDIQSQRTNVSLGRYADGIYLLTIEKDSLIETYKIIKKQAR